MDTKIKIVRIITRLNIGGPATHAILLTKGLNNKRFRTILTTGRVERDEGEMFYLAKEEGVWEDVKIISHLKRSISFINDLKAFYDLYFLLKKERPHIVHTHTAKAGFLGRLAAMLTGVPIKVHSFHGHFFHSYFGSFKTKVFLLIERFFARFTDGIIVVSDYIKEDVCDHFKVADDTKTWVIKLGFDLDKFRSSNNIKGGLRRELDLDDKILLVGIVGRLTPIKNHRLFLEAVRLLKTETPHLNAKFLIIGDGELRHNLEDQAKNMGIKDWVYFTGWRKDMPSVYADLDVVVLTSLNEGTPLSLIEAMAAQKPVVATAVGGVPNLIENKKTGLLIDTNDLIQLKGAIVTLLQEEELRKKMGQEGMAHVYNLYSKERLIRDMENLYEDLLKKKKIKWNRQ